MKYFITIISFCTFSGCASKPLKSYNDTLKESRIKEVNLTYAAEEKLSNSIKDKLLNKIFFMTTQSLCPISDLESVEKQLLFYRDTRTHMINNDPIININPDDYIIAGKNVKFNPFEVATVYDVKAIINTGIRKSPNSSYDNPDYIWDESSANIYIYIKQKNNTFIVQHSLFTKEEVSDFKNANDSDFYFESKAKDIFTSRCISKYDLSKSYKLSSKEVNAIKNNSVYTGMREIALILSQGFAS